MIEKIREYFIDNNIIDSNNRINVDFLGEEPTEFAIIPLPVEPILERYVNGNSLRQFQFQLLSCNDYGADVMQNIANSSFYENLADLIEQKNEDDILPDIAGAETIECLNNGTILDATTNTARYAIQMRIIYRKERNNND